MLNAHNILQKKLSLFQPGHLPVDLRVLQHFLLLLEEHFREKKEADFYADLLGVSIWRLGYLLKSHCKVSFYQLLQQRLLQEAELLLQESTLTVREITFELGLGNPSYFCRYFKKVTGLSPLEYRKRSTMAYG
jgi:AraC-like DNA-binding protein